MQPLWLVWRQFVTRRTLVPLPAGLQVRHCALSLVGEPIMYPRINELVRHLHANAISTFL